MIPPDLASRLRLATQDLPTPAQPVAPAQKLTDVLSDLSAGQRIMAEIQTLLPNGTYRALVGQRELTLALPFSAKAGDSIELEVTENDGKLALAVVANRGDGKAGAAGGDTSVSSSLSRTGALIGDLLRDIDAQGGNPRPAQLNGNQPLLTSFPDKAEQIVPLLKESLSKSGMFYESHQAQWVAGKLPSESLLAEPQGRLSPLLQQPPGEGASSDGGNRSVAAHSTGTAAHAPELAGKAVATETAPSIRTTDNAALPPPGTTVDQTQTPGIARELTPVVQQQLNALATQTYVWQGQIWPGQQMQWEITQENERQGGGDEPEAIRWQTRLHLELPNLGVVDASLRLSRDGGLEVGLRTGDDGSASVLRQGGDDLLQALQAAGMKIRHFGVGGPQAETEEASET